jgi:hypothetical protein
MANFWDLVNNVIRRSDVLLLVLDSRLIEETRNQEIEDKVKQTGKVLIYVLTKCDLVEQDILEQKKKLFNPCVFFSATNRLGTLKLRERIMIEAKKSSIKGNIVVGVLGYPNVGKSSLINAMKGRRAAPIGALSGITKSVQMIRSTSLCFLDTPGVIPYGEKDKLKHILTGTIDYTNGKDPDLLVFGIMKTFPGRLEAFYGVDVGDDQEDTLERICRKKNMLISGSKPDVMRMARQILKDWQKGLIPEKC